MSKPLKGVNIGGWLVVEKWMTPSLFKGTTARNEFELSNTKQGRERIKRHHNTFITEEDLHWLKQQNVEILRVPIGYWIFGDDRRYVESFERLDWLVATSLSYNFKLLLDLHAAPDAQNRAAHSGSGNTMTDNYSTKWLNNSAAQRQSIVILKKLAARYQGYPNIWGIQLLNEPAIDILGTKLVRFYRKAYKEIIKVARPGTHIVFSDAYAPLRTTNALRLYAKKDFPVVMDCHVYQVFGKHNKRLTFRQRINKTTIIKCFLQFLSLHQPIIVGEWSAMLPVQYSPSQIKQYVRSQLNAFSVSKAQFYWSYKTESKGRWNYKDMREKSLVQ